RSPSYVLVTGLIIWLLFVRSSKKRSLILDPPKARSRQCPLPSRASSIDLEHSESFVKPDHAPSILASAGLACSPRGPVRSLSLFYTQHGRASQEIGRAH